jgi:serine/threonine protein kinase/tetratricopeptide (TPR) repeat protein
MSDPEVERDPLEALAEEFVARQRRGKNPSVSEYAQKHPQLADQIRELFPTIVAVEHLKAHKEQSGTGRASLGAMKLERLGDFRIIREIGRGGMGIVFEAEQESLGRRVAIKVLPRPSLLDPKHLKRFEREARIAAGLHHTNIVEVFGVGEQDGLHYFVMQYIRGMGLDRIIWRLREIERGEATAPVERGEVVGHFTDGAKRATKYWQTVARIGLQVADALQYAHAQGTLHRDIKPANLLVDAHGAVWLSDFGLAKALQSENLSHTGDISGTLRYMAPEQFSGQTDVRSDIYSLGLTLYELLTLQPAYDDADRTRLMGLITQGQAPPPPPRKIAPQVPSDLETIVLKAMSREPAQRYASAGALADDLRCFLEDRPIQARRVTAVERLWRWSRRNRVVAGLAGTTLLSLLLVAIVATTAYVRTRSALKGEATQREKAEATAVLAIEALDCIFQRYSPSPIAASPELSVEGAEGVAIHVPLPPVLPKEAVGLLRDMLTFFDPLATQLTKEARPHQKAAEANRRVGDIHQRLGQYDEAATAYHRAIDIYRRLARASPENSILKIEVAKTFNELGCLSRSTGQNDQARRAHMEALRALESLPRESSGTPEVRYELARTHYFLAVNAQPLQERPPRPEHGARPNPPPPPGPPPRPDDAEGNLEKAVVLFRELATQYPSNPNYRHMLALCFRNRSESLNKATELLEQLVHDFPGVPDYRYDLSETYAMPDPRRPLSPGQTLAALEERFRKALSISEKLVAEYPHIPNYAVSEAHIYGKLGEMLRREHKFDEADQCGRKAVAIQRSLVNQFPMVPFYKVWLAAFQNSLAELLAHMGKLPEARSLHEDSITTLTGLLDENPDMGFIHGMLVKSYRDLAAVLRQIGESERASKAQQQSEEHRMKMRPGPP